MFKQLLLLLLSYKYRKATNSCLKNIITKVMFLSFTFTFVFHDTFKYIVIIVHKIEIILKAKILH